MRDLLFALRSFARAPGTTAVLVLTLALGIGATTVVFDLFNLFYWRPPPVERPAEVVQLYTRHPQAFVGPYGAISWPDFLDYRQAVSAPGTLHPTTPEGVTLVAYRPTWTSIEWRAPTAAGSPPPAGAAASAADGGPPSAATTGSEEAEVLQVTGDLFATLGLRTILGRPLEAEDDRRGAPPVAVLSHSLWSRLGDDGVLGGSVAIGGTWFQVVGVMEPGFRGLFAGSDVDALIPAEVGLGSLGDLEDARTDRAALAWNVLARLPPGLSGDALEARLDTVAERLDEVHPLPNVDRDITAEPIAVGHPVDQLRLGKTLYVFAAAVSLLVLIACANVSNLLLARAVGRRREMGIRQSIGADRWRLVRQLLTESLLLAALGSASGLVLALGARRLMSSYFGPEIVLYMQLDHRVLGATVLVSVAVTLLFGLAPALITSRVDLVAALGNVPPRDRTGGRLGGRSAMAALQIALALVLLVCCGVLVADLWSARRLDLGFDTTGLLVASVELPPTLEPEEGRAFYRELRRRAGGIPGVRAVTTALLVPPVLLDVTHQLTLPEEPEVSHRSRFNIVDVEYFTTLGLPLLSGRTFTDHDSVDGRGVAVVNRALAAELWPGRSPLGRMVKIPRTRPGEVGDEYEIVGVVGDVVQFARSTAPEPAIYFSSDQRYRPLMRILLRASDADPEPVFAALRDELRALDPELSLYRPSTHRELRWEALVDRRLQTQTVGVFGASGLFLALLGVFAVVSYSVSQQAREIGIRMAVGARRVDIARWILARGMLLSASGVGAGLLASFWALRALRGAIPGLAPASPAMVLGAGLTLVGATALAVWIPARRASRTDPLRALRR